MIRQKDGKPLEIKRPNPLMVLQAPQWIDGKWINGNEFGEETIESIKEEQYFPTEQPIKYEDEEIEEDIKLAIDEPMFQKKEQENLELDELYGEKRPNTKERENYRESYHQKKEDEEMIRNTDGTPYTPSGNINMFDPESPDHDLNDEIDQEMIRNAGAQIEYHRVIIDDRIDELYLEQRQKVFLSEPICMYAVYEPTTPILSFGGAGTAIMDSIEEMTFLVNKKNFLELVGEMPRVGSLIKTCDEGVWWEIIENQINFADGERKIWGKHRIGIAARKYRPSNTDRSPSMQGREKVESGRGGMVRIR